MRIVARSSASSLEQRRELTRRKRAQAGAIHGAFPAVERLQLELSFLDADGHGPSRQLHALFPAAPAHFEFPCPHGDCDGGFDLNAVFTSLMAKSSPRTNGRISCPGRRAGIAVEKKTCGLQAHYRIEASYTGKAG